jgi:response regulator RpfG family c-di-GMP phosphodiesterase/pSer/pThr/pTyr-binding forkhead associated (FHA) protein
MQIRIKTGPNKNRTLAVLAGSPIIVGRDATCGLQIIDRGVSREHAKIVRIGEMVFLHDLDSRNGSFVNGERVKEELLREGDVIRVGATQLVFESLRSKNDDLEYDESGTFRSSLELNVNDLYVAESGANDRASGHFRAICRATSLFQVERDESALLNQLLGLLQEYIPASNAYIFLKVEGTNELAPRAIRSSASTHAAPISRSILSKVINESKAILTADAMADERFNSGDSIVKLNIRSLICVPVAGTGVVHGAIYAVNSSLTEAFDEPDLQLVSALGSQLAIALDNLRQTALRRRIYFSVIARLVSTLEGQPYGVPGHGERVSGLCTAIATELGLAEREIVRAALAGLLHDIGKLNELAGAPEKTENPQGSGVQVNFAELGVRVLAGIPDLETVIAAVRSQYENFDGSGFPEKLKGDAIPVGARIVAVASGFDKLMAPKGPARGPYDGVAVREAFLNLEQYSGVVYDPAIVNALMVAYRHGHLGGVKALIPAKARDTAIPGEDVPTGRHADVKDEEAGDAGNIERLNTIRVKKDPTTEAELDDGEDDWLE